MKVEENDISISHRLATGNINVCFDLDLVHLPLLVCLMPLKAVSIPRGELIACQLAVRLAKSVCKQLGLNKCRVKYLSDSTTALWWTKSEPRKFRAFVANRVAE